MSGQASSVLIEPRYLTRHTFLCYAADGAQLALHLHDRLKRADIGVWLDQRDALDQGPEWQQQVLEALQTCHVLLLVLTRQSAGDCAECEREWKRALAYKKPATALEAQPGLDLSFELEGRQCIALCGDEDAAFEALCQHLAWLDSAPGCLQTLQERLAGALRALLRVRDPLQRIRVQSDIEDLQQEITRQQQIAADPRAAQQRVRESIARGIERERQPCEQVSPRFASKFINPRPAPAPGYFQDRHVETKLIGDFLNDETRRLLIVAGRAGIGKTVMVCRLLQSLEQGRLPDELGPLRVSGIVYLSAAGARPLNVPTLFVDLCRFLPWDLAAELDQQYRDPQRSAQGPILSSGPGKCAWP